MAMIRIDPDEMTATASVLRSLAVEVAQIGSEIPGCCCCAMPATIESTVRQLVATADSVLDEVARLLGAEATNLSQRAGFVTSDPPATGSAGVHSASMTIGGGGSAITVLGAGPSAVGRGAGIIGGGGSDVVLLGGGGAAAGASSVSIGGGGPAWWREASDRETNRIALGQPPNVGLLNAVKIQNFGVQSNNALAHTILTPSRTSVENSLGHSITSIDYERMYPPVSPPQLKLF